VLLSCPAAAFGAETDEAVIAGREALRPWWGYPWYDAQADAVRPIEVAEPWEPPDLFSWLAPLLRNLDDVLLWGTWILLAVVLLWLAYLAWRGMRRRRSSVEVSRGADRVEPITARQSQSLPVQVAPQRADLLGWAEKCYREGDYSQAIVYLFSYLLVQLDRRQLIHLSRGKTNRQYLRELGAQRRLRELLGQTMEAFEAVFFGNRRLDRSGFEHCWRRLDEFHRLVGFGG